MCVRHSHMYIDPMPTEAPAIPQLYPYWIFAIPKIIAKTLHGLLPRAPFYLLLIAYLHKPLCLCGCFAPAFAGSIRNQLNHPSFFKNFSSAFKALGQLLPPLSLLEKEESETGAHEGNRTPAFWLGTRVSTINIHVQMWVPLKVGTQNLRADRVPRR